MGEAGKNRGKTPMAALRAVIEEIEPNVECVVLHEIHGDEGADCSERGCIDCRAAALGEVADLVEAELNALKARALPEGMEWPCYEDGEPVELGGEFECWRGETHAVSSVTIREGFSTLNGSQPHSFVVSDGPFTAHGKRVKRPVLDADGVPIKKGDTVWRVGRYRREFEVLDPNDADHEVGERFSVKCLDRGDGEVCWCDPRLLTHTKPKPPDSWERIEEDKGLSPFDYCNKVGHKLLTFDNAEEFKASDLVRRCKALAGVSE